MEFLGLPLWQVFVVIGIVLSAAEMLVPGFVLLPIGLGFFAGAVTSLWFVEPVAAWIALAVCVALSSWLCAKFLKPVSQSNYQSNADRLVGQTTLLLVAVTPAGLGQIKVSGDVFFVRTDDGQPLAAGASVKILRFEGNRAVVAPVA